MSSLLVTKDTQVTGEFAHKIQIFHCKQGHWITVTSMMCNRGEVKVFDSSFSSLDPATDRLIRKEFKPPNGVPLSIKMEPSQKQKGAIDCGVISIVNATAIAHGLNLTQQKFKQDSLQPQLYKCFKEGHMLPFCA